ncbi:MAG: TRAP transporter small permease subunit [Bacillota bacterium]|nr:TRAP transporter small permease subunit [Bacillota bacterium]MDW7685031.1 TRAP transporter small permease subunit [Bacillota bacterium]
MVIINGIIKVIDTVNEKISQLSSFLIYGLILTLSYEVFARYVLGSPTQWSFDTTYFISSLFIMLSMAYTWKCCEHVGVDLISSRLPKRVTAFLNVIFILGLFYLAWGNIARVMYVDVVRSWAMKERSTIGFMPPIYPYKTWIFAGVIMMLIQGASQIIKEFLVLLKGGEQS